ncbi:MAG: ADP-ribosylglycohydrolase family protein [Bacteroidales bacterium]|nr:ADP-ribosylglycohydrolase family protein [Bacteroidales bacterium]
MLGAIIGDIVGSRWEFDPTNNYDFQIFSAENGFTDDTICTIGVADALLHGSDDYGKFIHKWCRKYPHPMGGYGGRFAQWVASDNPKPYNSFGNGAAMRVSPVAIWFADTDEAKEEAQKTAACSHNHPEGMKGASAVAEAINMAIHACLGKSDAERTQLAKEICKTVSSNNGYNFDIDLQSVTNKFDETCQGTVPVAFRIIADSQSFEDAIRKAVALGADADTLGAIVGSIAEHIWGIPDWIKEKALSYLPEEMRNIIKSFYEKVNIHTK